MARDIETAIERLTDELVDGAGDDRSPDELAYATVSDIRLILSANREMREMLTNLVAAVAFTETDGRRSYGIKPQSFPPAYQAARSALTTQRGKK